jgi:hypothetical protein
VIEDAKESSDSTDKVKEQLWDASRSVGKSSLAEVLNSPLTSLCSLLTFFFLQRGKYVFAAFYKNDFLSYFKDLVSLFD